MFKIEFPMLTKKIIYFFLILIFIFKNFTFIRGVTILGLANGTGIFQSINVVIVTGRVSLADNKSENCKY